NYSDSRNYVRDEQCNLMRFKYFVLARVTATRPRMGKKRYEHSAYEQHEAKHKNTICHIKTFHGCFVSVTVSVSVTVPASCSRFEDVKNVPTSPVTKLHSMIPKI